MSEQQFMDRERTRLMTLAVLTLLNNNVAADFQAEQMLNATFAPRVVRTVGINPAAFAAQIKTDDAALKKYYEANKKNYQLAQGIKFQYIHLSPKTLADKQTVSEAELKQALSEQGNAQVKRRVSHILIADADKAKAKAEAEKIAAEAKANPAQFAELAKKHSKDEGTAKQGGNLGDFSQDGSLSKMGGKAFEDAVFALKSGEISGVIESDFGFHIVQVADNNAGGATSPEDAVRKTVQEKKAQQAYAKLREELSELAFAHPKELKAAADKTGLSLQTQEQWLTRANAKELKIPDAVVEALFSDEVFQKKNNSEAIGVDGETWFVRALETRAESIEAFDAVKERVKEDYIRAESLRLAREDAKKLLADLQAGKKTDATWSPTQEVIPAQARAQLPEAAYQALMKAVPKNGKPAYALVDGKDIPEIVEVQSIKPTTDSQALAMAKQYLAQAQGEALAEAFIDGLRATVKTQTGAERVSDE